MPITSQWLTANEVGFQLTDGRVFNTTLAAVQALEASLGTADAVREYLKSQVIAACEGEFESVVLTLSWDAERFTEFTLVWA